MTLTIGKWRRAGIPILKLMVERDKANLDAEGMISKISVATGIHIVAITTYYIEEYGVSDELTGLLDRLLNFYRITRVIEFNEESL